MKKSLLIAVDFDGTVVEDRYPAVGKPMPFAIETLKMLQSTATAHPVDLPPRQKLDEAVEFLKKHGVPPYASVVLTQKRPSHKRREPEDSCRPIHRRSELVGSLAGG